MEKSEAKSEEVPLIESSSSGTSSAAQTLGNIIVSIVGTGILGLPYAFKIAGWLAGSIGIIIAGLFTYYCMLLLVKCRNKVAAEEQSTEIMRYGDLGYRCMGKSGRFLTDFLIFFSSSGGSVASLIFIGQNLSSALESFGITYSAYVFMLVLIQIGLSWIGSLSALASVSIFADICNVLAMALVVKADVQQVVGGEFSFSDRKAISSNIRGLPFAGGVAVYCFDGFGMTLVLEQSMKDRRRFGRLLGQAFTGITLVYTFFAFCGYMAFGEETEDIVTLNLPRNRLAIAVQIGLCMAMTFTFPILMHPIYQIVEGKLYKLSWSQKLPQTDQDCSSTILRKLRIYSVRAILAISFGLLASWVPGFSEFSSLVGSTVCALLSYVLPTTFHLIVFGSSMPFWQRALDYFLIVFGFLFAAYGTYDAFVGVQ